MPILTHLCPDFVDRMSLRLLKILAVLLELAAPSKVLSEKRKASASSTTAAKKAKSHEGSHGGVGVDMNVTYEGELKKFILTYLVG
ncbi:hypothetical protein COLO4_35430 [Corchorus olitorius]|uniref:Uncharacterized protein n=1 Tax=Corchorus olitorius TaxID=93759 RepID=A0A1R3GGY0_9ROSI|nr:hypothetical protein COLO4_35430 [Corchorus olitorius]